MDGNPEQLINQQMQKFVRIWQPDNVDKIYFFIGLNITNIIIIIIKIVQANEVRIRDFQEQCKTALWI